MNNDIMYNSLSECDGGKYGQDCGNTCGSCINETQCHHINGTCLKGCDPGYKGDKCTEGNKYYYIKILKFLKIVC